MPAQDGTTKNGSCSSVCLDGVGGSLEEGGPKPSVVYSFADAILSIVRPKIDGIIAYRRVVLSPIRSPSLTEFCFFKINIVMAQIKPNLLQLRAAIVLTLITTCQIVRAGTNVWSGASGTDLNWSTPGNWTPSSVPGAND